MMHVLYHTIAGAFAVITANQAVRGEACSDLKTTVDEALKECPNVGKVFIVQRTPSKVKLFDGRDVLLEKVWSTVTLMM